MTATDRATYKRWSPEVRDAAVELLAAGVPLRVVSEQLGVPHSTLERWRRQHVPEPGRGPECLGFSPHIAPLRPGAEHLTWWADPGEVGRVIAHTCDCVPDVYELVSYRGRYRIRRTHTGSGSAATMLTADAWVRATAEETWRRLLAGAAH